MIDLFFESYEADRLADCRRIEGANETYLRLELQTTRCTLEDFVSFLENTISESDVSNAATHLTTLLTDGFMIGNALGGDLARSVVRRPVREGGSRGGTSSGQTRRDKRADSWEPIAKALAKRAVAKDPLISREKQANEIYALWNSFDVECVSHGSLLKLLKRMEDEGELPRRVRSRSTAKGLQ